MDTQELMSRVAENLSVRRAFGTAYEKDGVLVIPVGLVAGGGGGGEGTMLQPGPLPPDAVEPAESRSRGGQAPEGGLPVGSGGGFGGLVLPVGVYVVKGDQVRWVPAVDVTLIALAGLGLARLLVRLRARLLRHEHHVHA